MKKPSLEKVVEVGSTVLTLGASVLAMVVANKKQKKMIDEAVVKHLAEKK